jgi:ribosomal protein L29
LKNTTSLYTLKKDIAQIKTILTEKELIAQAVTVQAEA